VLKRPLLILAILLLGLGLGPGSQAMVVKNLYSAEVVVADNSQKALAAGSRAALSEVLVKISGRAGVLQNPVLASALDNSRNLVQQYAYIRQEADSSGLLARFEFDESVISNLVAKAGVPLWTANRPPVLVWLVIEGPGGKQFLNSESAPEMLAAITAEFSRRGVPAQFPLYDLNDAALLSVDDVWALNGQAISEASRRYGVQNVLAGRLATLSSGRGVGDWAYLSAQSRIDRSIPVGNSESFLRAGVALVAEEMSERYAVAPTAVSSEGVKIIVTGVSTYSDYAGVVSWLEGLELIEYANIETIRGDTISLNLVAQADAEQLAAIIELNKKLVPLRNTDPAVELSYQWQK